MIGNEILVKENGELTAAKVKKISGFVKQGIHAFSFIFISAKKANHLLLKNVSSRCFCTFDW